MFVLTLTDKCNAYRFKYDNFCHINFIYATFCIHIIVSVITVKYQDKTAIFRLKSFYLSFLNEMILNNIKSYIFY